jgi:hypothetical protein
MSEDRPTSHRHPSDRDLRGLLERAPAGVETAMRVLEEAERAYYGAVAATSPIETETIGTTTSPSSFTEPR